MSLVPATPTRFVSRSSSSSPSTPHKKTDSEIIADIQASVRAREKKRLAEEAEEKARVVRELRLAAGLSESVSVDSKVGVGKEDVLRQVRTWRKERETSIKSTYSFVSSYSNYTHQFQSSYHRR